MHQCFPAQALSSRASRLVSESVDAAAKRKLGGQDPGDFALAVIRQFVGARSCIVACLSRCTFKAGADWPTKEAW